MNHTKHYFSSIVLAVALYLGAPAFSWAQNLVMDGNFTSLTPSSGGQLGYNVNAAGWSTTGYNFVFVSPNAGDTAVTGSGGSLSLWGPANGSANGLTLPPGGGNVVAADGAYEVAPITQVINLLTPGYIYTVSFEWAAGQQNGFTGVTTDSWSVALGGAGFTPNSGDTGGTLAGAQTTNVVTNPSHGFTAWMTQSFNFTATSTSETLYFLANGTPTGEPPFALLADVTVVPEIKGSSCWMILFALLIMGGNWIWRQRQKRLSTHA